MGLYDNWNGGQPDLANTGGNGPNDDPSNVFGPNYDPKADPHSPLYDPVYATQKSGAGSGFAAFNTEPYGMSTGLGGVGDALGGLLSPTGPGLDPLGLLGGRGILPVASNADQVPGTDTSQVDQGPWGVPLSVQQTDYVNQQKAAHDAQQAALAPQGPQGTGIFMDPNAFGQAQAQSAHKNDQNAWNPTGAMATTGLGGIGSAVNGTNFAGIQNQLPVNGIQATGGWGPGGAQQHVFEVQDPNTQAWQSGGVAPNSGAGTVDATGRFTQSPTQGTNWTQTGPNAWQTQFGNSGLPGATPTGKWSSSL